MQQQRFLCGAEPDILKTFFIFSQDSSLRDYSDVSISSWLTTFRTNSLPQLFRSPYCGDIILLSVPNINTVVQH